MSERTNAPRIAPEPPNPDTSGSATARWRMTNMERLTVERDEARDEALLLRAALTGLLNWFGGEAVDADGLVVRTAEVRDVQLRTYRAALAMSS